MLHINSGSLITPSSGANGDEIRAEWRDHMGQNVPNPSFTFYLRSFADVSTFSAHVDLQAGVIWSSEFLHGTLGGKVVPFRVTNVEGMQDLSSDRRSLQIPSCFLAFFVKSERRVKSCISIKSREIRVFYSSSWNSVLLRYSGTYQVNLRKYPTRLSSILQRPRS